MHLSTVDRFVSTLRPVNALVENLCERLLPNKIAYAATCDTGVTKCLDDWGCGVEIGYAYATYCVEGFEQYTFMGCGC